MTTETDPLLRQEVRLLGELLGETLRTFEGDALYALVEEVRALAKAGRQSHHMDTQRLRDLLSSLDVDQALPLARAFSHFLRLANVAEQRYQARATDEAGIDLDAILEKFAAQNPDKLIETLTQMRVELILTAHPTQAIRRTLRQKYRRISDLLEKRQHESAPDIEEALRREVIATWHTDELRRARPTPVDEARAGLVLFEQILWDAVPSFMRALDEALHKHTGKSLPLNSAPIRFGSWMGGDRDGNPYVTAEVTREVFLLSRWMGADLYARELALLHDELSVLPCSETLRKQVGDAHEPYRAHLKHIQKRLRACRDWCEQALDALHDGTTAPPPPQSMYRQRAHLYDDLMLCYQSLHDVGLGLLAQGRLLDVLRRVSCFGLTLLPLDIRQESSVHTEAMVELAQQRGDDFAAMEETDRQTYLLGLLEEELSASSKESDTPLDRVLDCLRVCTEFGHESLGAYVVSMASTPSDVLTVYVLQKAAGLAEPMRVVPLFETLDDLSQARQTVSDLLDVPWFHTKAQEGLEVMLGYSDSAKDAGRLSSAWALYRAQEELSELCQHKSVPLTIFHGRGGTIGRGGGPIYLSIFSQPPGSVGGRLRVTVQGEAIDANFGLPAVARLNLSRYCMATLEATLAPPPTPKPQWRSLMDEISAAATEDYRSTVRGNPDFLRYFHAATPQDELGQLNIGSRPARRKKQAGIESLRAIPWIFAWTQTRLLLPSWLGVGAALASAKASQAEETLGQMLHDWPFFRSLINLVEMVLAKADADIAECYESVLVPVDLQPVGQGLREKMQRTMEQIIALKGSSMLLEDDGFLRQSIALRNPYVDPLNLLQIEFARRLREQEEPQIRDALLVTINGIAAGMRNTG